MSNLLHVFNLQPLSFATCIGSKPRGEQSFFDNSKLSYYGSRVTTIVSKLGHSVCVYYYISFFGCVLLSWNALLLRAACLKEESERGVVLSQALMGAADGASRGPGLAKEAHIARISVKVTSERTWI